jgi:hypothetical protein
VLVYLFCCCFFADAVSSSSSSSDRDVQLQCSICDRRVGNWNFLCIDAPAAGSTTSAAAASSDSTTTAASTTSTNVSSDATPTTAADTTDAEQPQRKRRRTSGGGALAPMHLLHEHQSYCPWVHSGESLLHPDVGLTVAEAQAVRTGSSGWELALQALLRAARLGGTAGGSGVGSSDGAHEQQQQLAWVPCERTLQLFQETQQLLGEAFK